MTTDEYRALVEAGPAGMAQLYAKEMADRLAHENALKMAGKLGEYAKEREARLIKTFWRLIAALVAIIFLLAVFA